MQIPPLYPDTVAVRQDFARLYDLIHVMDRRVGEILRELSDSGLAEQTVVMFWSDHGDSFPRAKRWIYDTGTRVPLLIRIPEPLRKKLPPVTPTEIADSGSVDDRLISLIDLGPTVLDLAGISVPEHMHGQPIFKGTGEHTREYVYGARDRIDERPDLVRSVRDRRYRYVRHLMPWFPAFQHLTYAEQGIVRQEMRKQLSEGTLPQNLTGYFESPRQAEELFDLQNDPWELNNLATDPQHLSVLRRMSDECDRWQTAVRDVHLIPEAILDGEEHTAGSRWQILRQPGGEGRLKALLNLAKLVSQQEILVTKSFLPAISSDDEAARWWAATALAVTSKSADNQLLLRRLCDDQSPAVRIAAAGGLLQSPHREKAVSVLQDSIQSESKFLRHAALLQVDAAGAETIRLLLSDIRGIPPEEYTGRIAKHAESQLLTP